MLAKRTASATAETTIAIGLANRTTTLVRGAPLGQCRRHRVDDRHTRPRNAPDPSSPLTSPLSHALRSGLEVALPPLPRTLLTSLVNVKALESANARSNDS